jgi:signal transduction histidine kinase
MPPPVADDREINRLRHDLRTPLTVVIGFAELLASDRVLTDEQRRDYASRVLASGVEMRELIDSARLGSSAGHPDRD